MQCLCIFCDDGNLIYFCIFLKDHSKHNLDIKLHIKLIIKEMPLLHIIKKWKKQLSIKCSHDIAKFMTQFGCLFIPFSFIVAHWDSSMPRERNRHILLIGFDEWVWFRWKCYLKIEQCVSEFRMNEMRFKTHRRSRRSCQMKQQKNDNEFFLSMKRMFANR